MDAREIGNQILRNAGLVTDEALRAKRDLDARLAGFGLPPTVAPPLKVAPGATTVIDRPSLNQRVEQIMRSADAPGAGGPGGAVGALLLRTGQQAPEVVPAADVDLELDEGTIEPTDLSAAVACTSLATTAAGGTEVKFNKPGIVYIGPGPGCVYWNRALGASINTRWVPLGPGLKMKYNPAAGLFIGTNTVGPVAITGAITLAFFELPAHRSKRAWSKWRKQISEWNEGGDNTGTAGPIAYLLGSGGFGGTDVTLGTFSDAGAGTQIYKAATNMPVGGATSKGSVVLNAPGSNSDAVWVGETAALAVASNGAIMAAGQDTWSIPSGGKLFMLANSGTQKLGARYRS